MATILGAQEHSRRIVSSASLNPGGWGWGAYVHLNPGGWGGGAYVHLNPGGWGGGAYVHLNPGGGVGVHMYT